MIKSKKMSKSTVAIILLSLLLCLSLILTATGAWFTDSDDGASQKVEGTFGTVKISLTDDEQGEWSTLTSTGGNDYVMPGSSITLAGGTIENEGNVDVYAKVEFVNVKCKIGSSEVALADYFKSANVFQMPAGAVEGYTDMYLIKAGETGNTLEISDVSLTFKDAELINEGSPATGQKLVENGTTVEITYQLKVSAIQADNISVADAAAALGATAKTV